jgi:hypothetical protein
MTGRLHALLLALNQEPERTHSIERLLSALELLGLETAPLRQLPLKPLQQMTTASRYPDGDEAPVDLFDERDGALALDVERVSGDNEVGRRARGLTRSNRLQSSPCWSTRNASAPPRTPLSPQAAIQADQRAFVVHRQCQEIGIGELGGIQQPIVDDAWAGEKAQAVGPEPVPGMGKQPLQQGCDHRGRAGTVIGQVGQAQGAEPANQRWASSWCT